MKKKVLAMLASVVCVLMICSTSVQAAANPVYNPPANWNQTGRYVKRASINST